MRTSYLTIILASLLLTGCFMESATPLSPVEEASYPESLLGTWVMLHNKNSVLRIEAEDAHQLKITNVGRGSGPHKDIVSTGHISHIQGASYFNNKPGDRDRYEFYKFEQPCNDLILMYLPNPELIDKDIQSGRVKGKIYQDFFTYRIIEENREGLVAYIESYQGKLFIPFRYLVRQSKVGNLPEECEIKSYPSVITGDKNE